MKTWTIILTIGKNPITLTVKKVKPGILAAQLCCLESLSDELIYVIPFFLPPEKHSLLFHDDMKLPKHQQVTRLSLFLLAHHLNPFTISHIDSRRSDHQCLCWIFVCLSGHFLGCAESFHLNSNRKRGGKKINSSNKSKTIMESIQYVEMPCFKLL